jgi:hypothetical protein
MDAGAAASFYRRKGYTVRENVRATGASGNEHKVPLLAEGPLGSLAVFFGGLDGVDGPEMGGARKAARDLGATPVLAAAQFGNQDRQTAARLGVVLLDDDAVTVEAPAAAAAPPSADPARAWPGLAPIPNRSRAASEAEAHPWPASGRVGGIDGPAGRAPIDVDDLLAPRRRPEAAPSAEAVMATMAPPEPTAPPMDGRGAEVDSFWANPRRSAAAPRPVVRSSAGRPFAWLDGESAAHAAPAAAGVAAEHDSIVSAVAPAPSPDERMAPPAALPAERLARRARLQKRLAWTLAGAALLYLFLKWWY